MDSPQTLATITRAYSSPFIESSPIFMQYPNTTPRVLSTLRSTSDTLDAVVQQKRKEMGIAHIRPLNLGRDVADKLRETIKCDPAWQCAFHHLIEEGSPNLLEQERAALIGSINLPWWNQNVLSEQLSTYDDLGGTLSKDVDVTHSYFSQIIRSLKLPRPTLGRPMSISGIILTADGILPLGLRAGQSFYDVVMTTPAGSIEYHSGANPIFETFYAEAAEELGLTRADFTSVQIVGEFHENRLSNTTYCVFRAETTKTLPELLQIWESAIDNREHKYLIPMRDNAESSLRAMRMNRFRLDRADPVNVANTTIDNVNSMLPQCIASLLVHHIQREGKIWGSEATERLGNQYNLCW